MHRCYYTGTQHQQSILNFNLQLKLTMRISIIALKRQMVFPVSKMSSRAPRRNKGTLSFSMYCFVHSLRSVSPWFVVVDN